MPYEILLYYRYTAISDPKGFAVAERARCERLNLKGRIIVGKEGLNGTVEGTAENTQKYIDELSAIPNFAETHFKRSAGTGNAFPRLSIKVREEIVSGHLGPHDVNPGEITGKYIYAEQLHDWISSGKEFYIVDMRNNYEHKIGFFKNSILPPLKNFRDLPKVLPILKHLKNKTIVTVCTGGVRCEKASGFLVKNGFTDVYQLYGGIVTYMEKYPEKNFKGKLYVFDGRITMGFNNPNIPHEIVGKCDKCGVPSERYVNCSLKSCNAHFICCESCSEKTGEVFCTKKCARDSVRVASGKKLWFKAKRYGYGWTPATWQGWLVLIVYILVVIENFWRIDSRSHSVSDTLINFVPPTLLFTMLLIFICYWRGEQPRWRWGK